MMREQFVACIRTMIGVPYQWGGHSRSGVDCSNLVTFCLQETGLDIVLGIPKELCAAALFDRFHANKVMENLAQPGSLYLYWSDHQKYAIGHVMILSDVWPNGARVLIGAHGGDSTTTGPDEAAAAMNGHGAMVQNVMAGSYWRSNFCCVVDPFLGTD
jgi:cell wall-associated NlpC family hydrolase